ncbi:hypothetical protein MUG78_16825 [Gordonia alkaliphila]|uniref:hypothetical protein n=1 Tax=Gordonia alkaliphila TaxID=1053547 RepID=UPI001FF33B07|nr:hypothetical protein [Gordonia alkaliphila]MCK0441065.1 hypothetical protein [Gordonia alkaliphila]
MQDTTWEALAAELAEHGLVPTTPRTASQKNAPGFLYEADWTTAATGHGNDGGRWLVTSVSTDALGRGAERWLIAYEIAVGGKTGRIVKLLEGPISEDADARLLAEAGRQVWWRNGAPDLNDLAFFVSANA